MLLSHPSHAHSLVWHAAHSDNTFNIRAKAVAAAHNKTAILIATCNAYSLSLRAQQTPGNNVRHRTPMSIEITPAKRITVV